MENYLDRKLREERKSAENERKFFEFMIIFGLGVSVISAIALALLHVFAIS